MNTLTIASPSKLEPVALIQARKEHMETLTLRQRKHIHKLKSFETNLTKKMEERERGFAVANPAAAAASLRMKGNSSTQSKAKDSVADDIEKNGSKAGNRQSTESPMIM